MADRANYTSRLEGLVKKGVTGKQDNAPIVLILVVDGTGLAWTKCPACYADLGVYADNEPAWAFAVNVSGHLKDEHNING